MYTIAETKVFTRLVVDYWTEAERGAFCVWIANNPLIGEVIPGSGGCRKVRVALSGQGKRGGLVLFITICLRMA